MKFRTLSSSMILHGTLLGGVAWVLGAGLSPLGREPIQLAITPTEASRPVPEEEVVPEEPVDVETAPPDCELVPDPLVTEAARSVFEPIEKEQELAPFRETAFFDAAWSERIERKSKPLPVETQAPVKANAEPQEVAELAPVVPQPAPESSRVDAVPLDDRNRPPQYPAGARRRGQEGEVLLRLHISVTGVVTLAELERGCPYDALNRAAVRAAQNWVFSPARENGAALAVVTTFPVVFRLEDPVRNLP